MIITKLVTSSVSSADVFVMYQETTSEKWREVEPHS